MADAALTATSFALSLFNFGGIGQLLQVVNVARAFGFSLDQSTGEMYPVELCVLMRDEASEGIPSLYEQVEQRTGRTVQELIDNTRIA